MKKLGSRKTHEMKKRIGTGKLQIQNETEEKEIQDIIRIHCIT